MEDIPKRYSNLMDAPSPRQKRYVHYKSLENFIVHIDEIHSERDRQSSETKIAEYLETIEEKKAVIDRNHAVELYTNYIHPLGETYKKNGFKEIVGLRYLILPSVFIDIIMWALVFNYPYPIATVLVLLNFFFRQRGKLKSSTVYGMFY